MSEFERMGARHLTDEEVDRLARIAFAADGSAEIASARTVVREPGGDGRLRGGRAGQGAARPPSRRPRRSSPGTRSCGRSSCRCSAWSARPRSSTRSRPATLVTEHGGLGHTSAVYATDENVIERFATSVRTGRILVNAPTAVGALGGVYNSMTPTFSLGCGTWGGSLTTDNVNYRNLLERKDGVPPPDAPAVVPRSVRHLLQPRRDGQPARRSMPARRMLVTDHDGEAPRSRRRGAIATSRASDVHVFADTSRSRAKTRSEPAPRSWTSCAPT